MAGPVRPKYLSLYQWKDLVYVSHISGENWPYSNFISIFRSHTLEKKEWNPYYEICNCTTKSIVYPYYIHTMHGNIQLLWISKIHSISNKGPYNFHSMTFYGFSIFFPVWTVLVRFVIQEASFVTCEAKLWSDSCILQEFNSNFMSVYLKL
jgi:hypothetical protein